MDRKTLAIGILIGTLLGIGIAVAAESIIFIEAINHLPAGSVNIAVNTTMNFPINETKLIEKLNERTAQEQIWENGTGQ